MCLKSEFKKRKFFVMNVEKIMLDLEMKHPGEVEYLQVLDEEGNADKELMPKLTDSQIKETRYKSKARMKKRKTFVSNPLIS